MSSGPALNPGKLQVFSISAGTHCYNLPYLSSTELATVGSPTSSYAIPIPSVYNYVPQADIGQVGVTFFVKILEDYLAKKLCYKDLKALVQAYLKAPFVAVAYTPSYYSTTPSLPIPNQGTAAVASSYIKLYKVGDDIVLDYVVRVYSVDYINAVTGFDPSLVVSPFLGTVRQISIFSGTLVTFQKRVLALQSIPTGTALSESPLNSPIINFVASTSYYYLANIDDPSLINKAVLGAKAGKSALTYYVSNIYALAAAVINNGFDQATAKCLIEKEMAHLCAKADIALVFPCKDNLVVFVGYVEDRLVAFAVKAAYIPATFSGILPATPTISGSYLFPEISSSPYVFYPLLEYLIEEDVPSLSQLASDPPVGYSNLYPVGSVVSGST